MEQGNPSQELKVNYAPVIYGDTFWLQSFGRVIILLWQMPKFVCYYTVFALFYFEFEGNFQVQAPRAYIWRSDLTEDFLRYEFRELIFRGAYTSRDLFWAFYGMS